MNAKKQIKGIYDLDPCYSPPISLKSITMGILTMNYKKNYALKPREFSVHALPLGASIEYSSDASVKLVFDFVAHRGHA